MVGVAERGGALHGHYCGSRELLGEGIDVVDYYNLCCGAFERQRRILWRWRPMSGQLMPSPCSLTLKKCDFE